MQTICEQANSKALIQNILTFKIKIKLINFLDFCLDLSRFFFRSILNKEFDKIVTKRKSRVIIRKKKETIVNINSINIKFIEIVYFDDIVAKVNLLQTLYFVACSITWVKIKNIKIKIMFDNKVEINCINNFFANKINLIIRQEVSISLIKVIKVRICFERVIKNAKISIDDIVIYISIFVVICFDYEILLKRSF